MFLYFEKTLKQSISNRDNLMQLWTVAPFQGLISGCNLINKKINKKITKNIYSKIFNNISKCNNIGIKFLNFFKYFFVISRDIKEYFCES